MDRLSDEEMKVLQEIIKDRLWWDEAIKRVKRISIIAGSIFAGLAVIASNWPFITKILQFLIKDGSIQ